ncbi:MAG: hypothetical protein KC416_08520, partial [Myxococcales bacterium]|nr:hypothetical protein [Myxococcales bacterium]
MDTIDTIFAWLKHPIAGKAVSAVFAVLLVVVVVRLTQRATVRYVQDKGSRYRVRKAITLLGYVAATLAIVSVFSDRLGQLTVVLGVAGAGVA